MKFQELDTSYFHGKNFFGDDGFQNIFVYQPTFNTLELKKGKGTEFVIGWKSKGVYNSKLTPPYNTFLPTIKCFGSKKRIQFNNTPLVEEQNSYTMKIVYAYIVYNLDNQPKIPLRNFTLKIACLR